MIANLVLSALVGYLLGSIPSGVIASRFFARRDVRAVGSGHIGALNTFRAGGLVPATLTFLADAGKAIVALEFARIFTMDNWGIALAGIAVVIGHCWPLYIRWRGGMGLTPAGAALFVLDPPILILLVISWFLLKFLVKRSPRASALVALLFPALEFLTRAQTHLLGFSLGVGMVLFWRHASQWNPKSQPGISKDGAYNHNEETRPPL